MEEIRKSPSPSLQHPTIPYLLSNYTRALLTINHLLLEIEPLATSDQAANKLANVLRSEPTLLADLKTLAVLTKKTKFIERATQLDNQFGMDFHEANAAGNTPADRIGRGDYMPVRVRLDGKGVFGGLGIGVVRSEQANEILVQVDQRIGKGHESAPCGKICSNFLSASLSAPKVFINKQQWKEDVLARICVGPLIFGFDAGKYICVQTKKLVSIHMGTVRASAVRSYYSSMC